MSLDVSALEPQIRQILSAPGTDLSTISAKRVRRRLLEIDPSLTAEILKENKDAVDAMIGNVFERVQAAEGGSDDIDQEIAEIHDSSARKRNLGKEATDVDTEEDITSSAQPREVTKATKKSSRELTDAELARQLSNEINSRSRRSRSLRGSVGSPRKGVRKTKSSELVDTDEDSGDGERKVRSKAKGGFGKEYLLSEPLAFLIGVDKLSRPQVVKQLWIYIKDKELQNPKNKREILCDRNLKAVFNADKIDMFKMNKVLGQHLHENEE